MLSNCNGYEIGPAFGANNPQPAPWLESKPNAYSILSMSRLGHDILQRLNAPKYASDIVHVDIPRKFTIFKCSLPAMQFLHCVVAP